MGSNEKPSTSGHHWEEQNPESRPDSRNLQEAHGSVRPVKFTIGGSTTSESESISTSASGSHVVPALRSQEHLAQENAAAAANFGDENNPFRKFHFHDNDYTVSGEHNRFRGENSRRVWTESRDGEFVPVERSSENEGDPEGELDLPCPDGQTRARGVSLSTTRMVHTPPQSLAQLTDIDSQESSNTCGRRFLCFAIEGQGRWRVLVSCAIVQLLSALIISLQAPFYPAEAEKKGATATSYGFVFGVFELTVFITTPFFGSRIHTWNPIWVFNLGVFTASMSSIVFGFLDQIENTKYFIAACVFIRVLEGLGEAALLASTFYIVASTYSDNIGPTSAFLESFYSIGLITGPLVGSFLYQFGGYSLPFWCVGFALLVAAFLNFLILPTSQEISDYQTLEPVVVSSYRSFRLLGSIPVVVSSFCILVGSMSVSYVQATLEPHLRQFELSQLAVGAILIINGAMYTLTAPFWGLVCDKVIVQLKLVAFCGAAVLLVGYTLVGPVPGLQFQPAVWIVVLALVLQGLGLSALLVASYVSIIKSVLQSGLPDTPSNYGQISSLWTSMYSLGSFVGPSLSGILFDAVGFANGTLVMVALILIMMCIIMLFICISDAETRSLNAGEIEPLLSASIAVSASYYSQQYQSNAPLPAFLWTRRTSSQI